MLTWYILPSIFALALKLTIFWYGRHSLKTASLWLWGFFIGLFVTNLIELVGFYYLDTPEKAFVKLILYYLFAEMTLISLFLLCLENIGKLNKTVKCITTGFFLVTAIPLFIPGAALAGIESIGYSLTRIPGPYYFFAQLGILLPLAGSIIISLYHSFNEDSFSKRRKSQILFFSCMPILFSALVVVVLMEQGLKINASIIVSLMTNVTLLILIYTERKRNQYKFMSIIPKTREHEFLKKLSYIITDPTIGLNRGRELIEREMIHEALITTQGNKAKAAEMLGISRQTLHRRLGQ